MIDMKVPFIAAALLAPASFAGTTLAAEPTAAVRPAQVTAEPPEGAPPAVEDEPAKETWWRPERHPPARFAVAVNPLGLLLGMFLAEFDYGLDERMSLNINGTYWSLGVLGYETTALGAGVGIQYFPAGVADSGPLYQGFYVYPSLQVASVSVEFLGFEESWVSVAPQAIVGWQWDFRPFTVRVGGGAAYYIGSVADGFQTDLDGLRFVLDGTVGLTFGG